MSENDLEPYRLCNDETASHAARRTVDKRAKRQEARSKMYQEAATKRWLAARRRARVAQAGVVQVKINTGTCNANVDAFPPVPTLPTATAEANRRWTTMNKTQDKAIRIRMHMQSYAYTCTHTHTYMNNWCFSTPSPQKGTTTDRSM